MNRRHTLLSIAVASLLGAASNLHGDDVFLDRINTDRIEIEPRTSMVRTATIARRVVVVFLDGLRDDVALARPEFRSLGEQGFFRTAVADFPSFTYPAIATIATGVPPAYSGVRLNWGGADPDLDSVSKRAAAAGFEVRVAEGAFAPFRRLLFLGPEPTRMDLDTAVTSSRAKTLTWIYFGAIDAAGHRFGADHDAYRDAAREGGSLVTRVVRHLDLARDTIFVVSDHGHLNAGGHGGTEPDAIRGVWIGAGAGVAQSGQRSAARLVDFAPTLAAVLGVEAPRHSFGAPSIDALRIDGDVTLLPPRDWRARDRDYQRAAARRTLWWTIAALLGAVVLARVVRLTWRDTRPTLVHTIVFTALYLVAGYGWTWTVPRGYAGFLLETVLFSALGIGAALWRADPARRAQEAMACGLLHGVPYVALAAHAGIDPRWMPGPFVSWGVVLVATAQFYVCLTLGARALWFEILRRPRDTGDRP